MPTQVGRLLFSALLEKGIVWPMPVSACGSPRANEVHVRIWDLGLSPWT